MDVAPIIVWLQSEFRLLDNPALRAAELRGAPVLPLYIWSPAEEGEWPLGQASRWWLHHSLTAFGESLRDAGSRLVIREGSALEELHRLIKQTGAKSVFWNRRYEPAIIKRDGQLKSALTGDGLEAQSFNSALLHEPWTVQNQAGRPFQVFTPFWKTCLAKADPPAPQPAPEFLPPPKDWPASLAVGDLNLLPKIDWAAGMRETWQPGEAGARARLQQFVTAAFTDYAAERNRPDHPGTSRLSPHLHFGELSPRQVWHAFRDLGIPDAKRTPESSSDRSQSLGAVESPPRHGAWRNSQFLAELGWREFAHHLLFHFPHSTRKPLRSKFEGFPWREDAAWLRAWQKGLTGYPFVDAGLRELWATGWMHNRARMVVGSFLVKDLLIDWRAGARWFWDTLVDADLANNTLGWQWVSGCGADAAPYFRVFNPAGQGEKFDPDGDYVRRWVPELSDLPARWIHRPFDAPSEVLAAAQVELGHTYPEPLVSHAIARDVALEAYANLS